ncbi:MAG: beta-1,6-N-acetylglucosaminyltransferase [Planctomycetota bacterium]
MLAYLIMTHKSPRQLLRMVEALQHPSVAFFVHVDDKVEEAQFRYMVRHHPNVRFIRPRHVVEWGGWSMVAAELDLVRAALRAGAQSMVLLSGVDYPVWSNRRLVEFFLGSDRSYVEHYRIPSRYWDRGALNRVRQYWLCDDPIRLRSRLWRRTIGRVWRGVWHRVIRFWFNLAFKLGFELGLRRKPPDDLVFHIGSQWWTLSRPAAEYVLDFVERRPDAVRFYRHSHVPDEGFIQTVVMNSPLRDRVVNDNLRFIEWDGGFNPRVLEQGDLDTILRSGSAFARKISLAGEKAAKGGRVIVSEPLMRALDEAREREERELEADGERRLSLAVETGG